MLGRGRGSLKGQVLKVGLWENKMGEIRVSGESVSKGMDLNDMSFMPPILLAFSYTVNYLSLCHLCEIQHLRWETKW